MTEKRKITDPPLKKRILPTFRIELEGRLPSASLTLFGARGVSKLSDTEIEIESAREFIKIIGKSLNISLFESKYIEISGKIDDVQLRAKSGKRGG
jgi:sporulation protein YqfC